MTIHFDPTANVVDLSALASDRTFAMVRIAPPAPAKERQELLLPLWPEPNLTGVWRVIRWANPLSALEGVWLPGGGAMIKTVNRAEAMALMLPGDIPGLLRDPVPVIEAGRSGMTGALGVYLTRDDVDGDDDGGPRVYWQTRCPSMVTSVTHGTALRLNSRAGLFAAIDWLGEGERCPACNGTGRVAPDAAYETCKACVTCGRRRPQYDLLWALRRDVDPAIAIVAVWLSVLRVQAGLAPVGAVYGPWREWGVAGCYPGEARWERVVAAGAGAVASATVGRRKGRKTVTDDREEKDADLLSRGFILLSGTLPDIMLTMGVPG